MTKPGEGYAEETKIISEMLNGERTCDFDILLGMSKKTANLERIEEEKGNTSAKRKKEVSWHSQRTEEAKKEDAKEGKPKALSSRTEVCEKRTRNSESMRQAT